MDNQPHVRFVDPHSESVCRNYNPAFVIFPAVLADRLFFPVQPGMKEIGRYSGLLQEESRLFCLFPVPGIDDGRTWNFSKYVKQCVQLVFRAAYDVGEIRAGETFQENIFSLE